jgi:hypothetical protein
MANQFFEIQQVTHKDGLITFDPERLELDHGHEVMKARLR